MLESSVVTISRFLVDQERVHPEATGAFTDLLGDIALAAKVISREVNKAGLVDILGRTGEENVHGEHVQKLDAFANDVMYRALDPFIQIMKPISPLAWMPLALYTLKDSTISSVFVIFICSIWPMLVNTCFGVASVRREWINVARTLEVGRLRTAFAVILPAAAPTIMTGMRISIGIAWLVIVAAEMLVGGTGIGYFVWNEWNNLSITNVICAIFFIGLIGMVLDLALAYLGKLVTYAE